jgi:aminoglycoside phosphotransferase (APT) family kinase protein
VIDSDTLQAGLARVSARAGLGVLAGSPQRLTGGAVMESWRFAAGDCAFVLRRAPSLAFMEGRPYGHAAEAALIEATRAKGVTAPEVVAVLDEADGLGSGFVMRALPGTADPKVILECDDPDGLLREAARDLARIHRLRQGDVPDGVPVMDYSAAIADLKAQFMDAGGDRPIIALGLRWLEDNVGALAHPQPLPQAGGEHLVLNHGDYRMGNLLVEDSRLTGVLDWELAHFGDPHEDLAFGCMAVWRFARYDRPALGLGRVEDYIAAYEAESGTKVDPARFRFWTIYRTVWWALGCLKMAAQWRSGADRMLERVAISRRTSEQELDLLLLLEEDAPEVERARTVPDHVPVPLFRPIDGEASSGEIATAIIEWLESIKGQMKGHDRFQNAVARNALGIIKREDEIIPFHRDLALSSDIVSGSATLAMPELLARLRSEALGKCMADSPKYPTLSAARLTWPINDTAEELS